MRSFGKNSWCSLVSVKVWEVLCPDLNAYRSKWMVKMCVMWPSTVYGNALVLSHKIRYVLGFILASKVFFFGYCLWCSFYKVLAHVVCAIVSLLPNCIMQRYRFPWVHAVGRAFLVGGPYWYLLGGPCLWFRFYLTILSSTISNMAEWRPQKKRLCFHLFRMHGHFSIWLCKICRTLFAHLAEPLW